MSEHLVTSNPLKHILTILLIGLFSISFSQTSYYVTAQKLNLRASATTTSEILHVLHQYDQVLVHSKSGEWAEISTDHGKGYVAAKYLAAGKAPERMAQPNQPTVLICVSSGAVAYHSYQCRGLGRCTHTIKRVTISEAKNSGYRACKICY